MNEYLARIKEIFDKHAVIGEPLNYRDKLMCVFNGLGEEYDTFVTSTLNRLDKPSLYEIYSLLYTFEYRMDQRMTTHSINIPQANLSTYFGNVRNPKYSSQYKNFSNPTQKNTHPTPNQHSIQFPKTPLESLENHNLNHLTIINNGLPNHLPLVLNHSARSVASLVT